MKKEEPKRITFKVSDQDHKEIKTRAAAKGMTIRNWVIKAIAEMIIREKKYE